MMARLNDATTARRSPREIIARYPRPKSALIPLLHLAQEQDGYVTNEAMAHIAELVGVTPAEVYGTASFYEMFKFEPVGKYLINICGDDVVRPARRRRADAPCRAHASASRPAAPPHDGLFTLHHAECQAACTEAPCLQVNYRYRYRVTPSSSTRSSTTCAAGALDGEIPPHGTLGHRPPAHPADRAVGAVARRRHRGAGLVPASPAPEASAA